MLSFASKKWTDSEKEHIRKMQDAVDESKKIKIMYIATDVSTGNVLCELNNMLDVISCIQGYAIMVLGTRNYILNEFYSMNHVTKTYSHENTSFTVDVEERVYIEN